jgi:hypothetical protein
MAKTTFQGPLFYVLTKYHSDDEVKKTEMNRAFSTNEESRCAYRILAGKHEGRLQFQRHRHRWEDNIKVDHRDVGWGDMDWIDLA